MLGWAEEYEGEEVGGGVYRVGFFAGLDLLVGVWANGWRNHLACSGLLWIFCRCCHCGLSREGLDGRTRMTC